MSCTGTHTLPCVAIVAHSLSFSASPLSKNSLAWGWIFLWSAHWLACVDWRWAEMVGWCDFGCPQVRCLLLVIAKRNGCWIILKELWVLIGAGQLGSWGEFGACDDMTCGYIWCRIGVHSGLDFFYVLVIIMRPGVNSRIWAWCFLFWWEIGWWKFCYKRKGSCVSLERYFFSIIGGRQWVISFRLKFLFRDCYLF